MAPFYMDILSFCRFLNVPESISLSGRTAKGASVLAIGSHVWGLCHTWYHLINKKVGEGRGEHEQMI